MLQENKEKFQLDQIMQEGNAEVDILYKTRKDEE